VFHSRMIRYIAVVTVLDLPFNRIWESG